MSDCDTCPQRGIESVTCDECGVSMAEHSGEVSLCGPANGAMAAPATSCSLTFAVDVRP